jgi:flagellar hook-length control protein FliK
MLPANLISTLNALALHDKPLITATPDKNGNSALKQFEVGQKLQGTVQAQVAPNVYNVRVADQLLQMQLPAFIRSGDTITLQVASLQPRLTFTLAASSNPVSTPESLSAAARLLSSLSQQPLERSYVRPIQNSPLWTGSQALPDTTQLAGKLHDALSHSGLFYESHQAQWIAGTRPTTQLLLEPQNQLTRNLAVQNAPVQSLLQDNAAATAQPAAPTTGDARVTATSIPDHLQPLVQQQMNALETHQVLWQGQVWQGQEMRWEVREESPRRNAQGEQEGHWITQISLDLPKLGGVSAKLSFNGGALSLQFEVDDEKTRALLGNASPQLVAALTEQGIPVTQTAILETAVDRST